jgi:hypothetical protein
MINTGFAPAKSARRNRQNEPDAVPFELRLSQHVPRSAKIGLIKCWLPPPHRRTLNDADSLGNCYGCRPCRALYSLPPKCLLEPARHCLPRGGSACIRLRVILPRLSPERAQHHEPWDLRQNPSISPFQDRHVPKFSREHVQFELSTHF